MKKIIIAGHGFVGKAVASSLHTYYDLAIVDTKLNDNKIADFPDAIGVIVCVGTPTTELWECDDSQIRAVLDTVPSKMLVLIKSTVTPDKLIQLVIDYSTLSICYSPEFLRAATADEDFANQTYMILSGDDCGFWYGLFTVALKHCKRYHECSITEAAMVKYTINSYLATKVSFFNQIYDMCQAEGISFETVKHLVTLDERIGDSHTNVPGHNGERGYGGACFPKDTEAFAQYAEKLDLPFILLESVIKHNRNLKQPK